MKKEDLFEAIGDIDDKNVKKAGEYNAGKPAWTRFGIPVLAAVILLAFVFAKPFINKGQTGGENTEQSSAEIVSVMAEYPKAETTELTTEEYMYSEEHRNWSQVYEDKTETSAALQADMYGYYSELLKRVLVREDENTVCSPLNTYIALSMLAEVTGGNTRQQILDVLGVQDIDALREKTNALWCSNYADTPVLKSLLANSVWLKDSAEYNADTLNILAKQYYASSFTGEPGSEVMDKALQEWTDKNTGSLLSEYTKDMELNPDTVLALVSTIWYKAMWKDPFYASGTDRQVFHGTKGDTEVDMMHWTEPMDVYISDTLVAAGRSLTDSGAMYFLVPNERTYIDELPASEEIFNVLNYNGDEHWASPMVHLSLPKFKVSGKTDLMDILADMGITDVMDPAKSDFTPLTQEDGLSLSTADHAAMVEVDENGVTGAAYSEFAVEEEAIEMRDEFYFVLDRPFMFIITGKDGSILFSGIVKNIE